MSVLGVVVMALAVLGEDPGGRAVLDSVAGVLGSVEDYTVQLEITAEMERISVAPMEATLYYKRPDRMHVEADGVAMIPREVLPVSLAALPENFSVERMERDSLEGRETIRLWLQARHANTRTRSLTLSVDPSRWVPLELTASSVTGRTVTAAFTFTAVDGFWLPEEVVIRLDAVAEDTSEVPSWEQRAPSGRRGGVPRRGTVRILYQDYRVNTGLPDAIFSGSGGGEGKRD